jgi:hypothetical protein
VVKVEVVGVKKEFDVCMYVGSLVVKGLNARAQQKHKIR